MDKLEYFVKLFGLNSDTNLRTSLTQIKNSSSTFNENNHIDNIRKTDIKIKESSEVLQYSKNDYVWTFNKNDKFKINSSQSVNPLGQNMTADLLSVPKLNKYFFCHLDKLINLHLCKPIFVNGCYSHQLKLDKVNIDNLTNKVDDRIFSIYPEMHTKYISFKFIPTNIFQRSHIIDLVTMYKKCYFPMQKRKNSNEFLSEGNKLSLSSSYFKWFTKSRLLNDVLCKSVWKKSGKVNKNKVDRLIPFITEETPVLSHENVSKPTQNLSSRLVKITYRVQNLHSKLLDEMTRREHHHENFLEECRRICSSTDSSFLDISQSVSVDVDFTEDESDNDNKSEIGSYFMQSQLTSLNSQDYQTKSYSKNYFEDIKSVVVKLPRVFITSCLYFVDVGVRTFCRIAGRNSLICCCF